MDRRSFISGLFAAAAAPAIVRAESLMPVRAVPMVVWTGEMICNLSTMEQLQLHIHCVRQFDDLNDYVLARAA